MGLPLPEPEFGDNCLACYAPGETPKAVVMFISGVEVCPLLDPKGPLGGAWVLPQVLACEWFINDGISAVGVKRNAPGGNTLFSQLNLGIGIFGSTALVPCASGGPNQNVCMPLFVHGELGACHVDFRPWPATPRMLCDDYGMLPSEDTKTDPYIIQDEPPTTVVYRFQNTKYSTKLGIKFDYTV